MNNNRQLMQEAKSCAHLSSDPDTKVGCLIVTPYGRKIAAWNDFPDGVDSTPERLQRPAKYKWIQHAEAHAISECAYTGTRTNGATMYLTWFPCSDCAKHIINAGLTELVCYAPDFDNPRWGEDFKIAHEMLTEAGVIITYEEKP